MGKRGTVISDHAHALGVRTATTQDLNAIVDVLVTSFDPDPVWSWVFPDDRASRYRALWPLFVRGGIAHGWTFVTGRCEAVALWLPPGAEEFAAVDAQLLAEAPSRLVGDDAAPRLAALFEGFEQAHHQVDPDHYYLSLLGTHDDHRGRGIGMNLLRENLTRVDAVGGAAYLESTNGGNLPRYRSVGFSEVGQFRLPDGPTVTTMWREAQPS